MEISVSFGSYLFHMYKTMLLEHQRATWNQQQWFTFCACLYRKYAKEHFYQHCQKSVEISSNV